MFAALGRSAHRRRKLIVVLWSLAFAAGLVASLSVAAQLKGGGFTNPTSPSQLGQRQMQERLGFGPASLTIVFSSDELSARSPAFRVQVQEALSGIEDARLEGFIGVRTAQSTGDASFIADDGTATFAVLEFDGTSEQVQAQIPALRGALKPTPLTTHLTGDPAVYAELEQRSAEDLRKAESYTIPVAILVLVLIFGTLVAAALPVIGGGMAVTVTLGIFWLLAQVLDISVFAMNVATLLGLAVGIDYALFMVGRFREELAAGRTVAEAVETTVATAGRSIFFSGIAVVIGLIGLVTFPYMSLRSMGWGGAIVVCFSVASALTLLPAVLGILGPRVDSLRLFGRGRREGRFWQRWSEGVMRHPWPILVGTVAVILVFAGPFLHILVNVPTATSLPTSQESRRGYDILQSRFDRGALQPIAVMLSWDGGDQDPLSTGNVAALYEYGQELARLPGVASVSSIVNQPRLDSAERAAGFWRAAQAAAAAGVQTPEPGLFPRPTVPPLQLKAARGLAAATTGPGVVMFSVALEGDPTSTEAQDLAVAVRGLHPPPGMQAHVAGLSAGVHDFLSTLYGHFPWVVLYIFVVTYVVVLVLLRSVVLPLKAVLMNTLAILASFGALVFIFQDGHFESILDFTSAGSIDGTLPVIMFCTVFGVSMDYEVFLLTRMREAWLETHDNQRAVAFGLARTGRIITSAALIIVIVTGSFALTGILITKALGVGLAVAIALDATVIRILLVPATMRILGRVNWWMPRWLDRVLPTIGEG